VGASARSVDCDDTYLLHRLFCIDGIRLHRRDTSSKPSRFNYSLSDHCVRRGCLGGRDRSSPGVAVRARGSRYRSRSSRRDGRRLGRDRGSGRSRGTRGRPPGGGDLAVMVAGLDLFPAGCLDRPTTAPPWPWCLRRTRSLSRHTSQPSTPYFPTKRAILPNKGSAHKTGDGSASDIDSGNRGLEGAVTMDPVKRWCLAR
jgi:hypothetical protein